jgi:hypothetical protein
MICWLRSGASLLVFTVGLIGLYGSSAPRCSGSEGDSPICVRDTPSGGGGSSSGSPTGSTPTTPAPVIPHPVVALNDNGIGYVAYEDNGSVTVRRLNGVAGLEGATTIGSGFEEDLNIGMAGGVARVAWRGENGRISVVTGNETGTWQTQMDVAPSAADDPIVASDQHANAPGNFVAWRRSETQSNGFPATLGYGSGTLVGPPVLVTRYAADEDVAPNSLFELRAATGGTNTMAVWVAAQRSDSSVSHIYASRVVDANWAEATRLAPTVGGQATAISMDEHGNTTAVWLQSDGVYFSQFSPESASGWLIPAAIRLETNPIGHVQLDVAANGRAVAAWSIVGGGVWAAWFSPSSGWSDIQQIDRDATNAPLNGQDPRVAIDRFGRAIVVWRGGGRAYASVDDAGHGWSAPELLGNTASAVDLDIDDDGLGVAVWWQDGLQSHIWDPLASTPRASFVVDPDPGVAGQPLMFDASGSAGNFPIVQYLWQWGDGTPDSNVGGNPTHAFQTPGSYTTTLQITDTAAQTSTATRTVHVAPVGELQSRVIVGYAGPGDGSIEIHSTQPGFTTVQCATHTGAGQPTDTGTCSATVLAGYEITIVSAYDPVRSIFSGWTEGAHACSTLSSATAPGGTRAECHFVATSADRTFNVTFAIAPPPTEILRVQLDEHSVGNGVIFSSPALISCNVQDQQILNATGGLCNYSITHGDTILVIAGVVVDGSRFLGWQGCDSQPATNQCSVAMNGFRTITATYGN